MSMDDDALAKRIRDAFDQVPIPEGAGFRDRHKRRLLQHRSGRWLVPVAGIATVMVLGGVLWVSALSTQTVVAWQAIPRVQDVWIVALAERACGSGASADKGDSGQPLDAGLPIRLVDARGASAVAFFTDGSMFATCQFSWDSDGTPTIAVAGLGGRLSGSSDLDVITARLNSEGRYQMIVGHSPKGVAKVTIDLASGPTTAASLGSGYYLAWWPSFEKVLRISAVDEGGNAIKSLEPVD